MKKTRTILSVLAIVVGAGMFVYGGYDDSPGAQLIGVVAVIVGIVGVIRSKKEKETPCSSSVHR